LWFTSFIKLFNIINLISFIHKHTVFPLYPWSANQTPLAPHLIAESEGFDGLPLLYHFPNFLIGANWTIIDELKTVLLYLIWNRISPWINQTKWHRNFCLCPMQLSRTNFKKKWRVWKVIGEKKIAKCVHNTKLNYDGYSHVTEMFPLSFLFPLSLSFVPSCSSAVLEDWVDVASRQMHWN